MTGREGEVLVFGTVRLTTVALGRNDIQANDWPPLNSWENIENIYNINIHPPT